MNRYIYAEDLEKAIRKKTNAIEVEDVLAEISNAPSIELVRCKDCVLWQLLTSPFGLCVWNEDNKRQMKETGFCSCGVKR